MRTRRVEDVQGLRVDVEIEIEVSTYPSKQALQEFDIIHRRPTRLLRLRILPLPTSP